VLVGILLAGLLGIAVSLDHFGQIERARPAPVIVVPGARVLRDGSAGDSLRTRTRKAVALYRRGLAGNLLFTGGQGDFGRPESIVAAELAQSLGVPAEDILREDHSHSTRENVENAAEICRAHGWRRVIVVSDPYHLWRARYLFARDGITAYPSPALDCERNRKPLLRLEWTLREALAVIHEVVVDLIKPAPAASPRYSRANGRSGEQQFNRDRIDDLSGREPIRNPMNRNG